MNARQQKRDSLFDGHSYLLKGLRSADERHAIAKLDVAIESNLDSPVLEALVEARHLVLGRMYDLSQRLDTQDERNSDAVALANAVRLIVGVPLVPPQ